MTVLADFPFGTSNVDIDVVDGSISSQELKYGDTFDVVLTVKATHSSDLGKGTKIDVKVLGEVKSKQTDYLSGGEKQTLTFTFDTSNLINSRDDYGTEYIYVDGEQFGKIHTERKGDFALVDSQIPSSVKEGDVFDVSFTFENSYLFSDVKAYGTLTIDGQTHDWDAGWIGAGETKTVTKSVTAPSKDSAEVVVNVRFGGTYSLGVVDIQPRKEKPEPADFSFSNLRVDVDGEKIHPRVDVTNVGGVGGDIRVDFEFDGNMKTNNSAYISAGGTKTVSGTYIPVDMTSAKVCAVEHGGDAKLCDTFSWGKIIKPLELSVSMPSTVDKGETFNVVATLKNTGDISKTGYVDLLVDGSVRKSKSTGVPPHSSRDIVFEVVIKSVGDYKICCDLTNTEV